MAVGPIADKTTVHLGDSHWSMTDVELSDECMRVSYSPLMYKRTVLVIDETMCGLGAAHRLIGL